MKRKYVVTLTQEERDMLHGLISSGKSAAKKLSRARILLKSDMNYEGHRWSAEKISDALDVGRATVERVRKQFVEEGFEVVLGPRKSKRKYRRTLDGDGEARLVALTCSEAPEGRSRWSLRLLADHLVELKVVDQISHETVRRTLKKRT